MKKFADLEILFYNFQYNLDRINYLYHYYFTIIIIIIIIIISERISSNTPGHRFFLHNAYCLFFTQPAQQTFLFGFGAKRDRGRGFSVLIIFRAVFDSCSSFFAPNCTKTLVTQATVNLHSKYNDLYGTKTYRFCNLRK